MTWANWTPFDLTRAPGALTGLPGALFSKEDLLIKVKQKL